ncbi:MAG TPA: PAS domain-containing sensor histidine kinase, partial [Prochlorococcaceae cyanobacterium Fu_MAG_50]|nr:PAS domain-containing sensor histidine kinase [Prochlorococcaceae cyanobacterium Fu_MAG_50]
MASSSTPAITEWAPPGSDPPPPEPSGWWRRISMWWAEFSLQTKLLAVATLVVSLMMTGITFLALNGIQRDA